MFRLEMAERFETDAFEPVAGAIDLKSEDIVFEGALPPPVGRWHEWEDVHAETGKTYAYFVSVEDSVSVGPVLAKRRHPEVWWDPIEIGERIERLWPTDVAAEKRLIGQSRLGRPIDTWVIGRGGPTVYLVAGVHPSESGPELVCHAMAELLRTDPSVVQKVQLVVVPCVNPDSRAIMAAGRPTCLRANAANVDLNRNFPAYWDHVSDSYGERSDDPGGFTWRGLEPASEPETQALMHLCEAFPPRLVISYHWLGGVSAPPMNHTLGILSWDQWDDRDRVYESRCQAVANRYGCAYFDTVEPEKWYAHPSISPGTLENWVYRTFGVPAFAVEGGRDPLTIAGRSDSITPAQLLECSRRHARALAAAIDLIADGN